MQHSPPTPALQVRDLKLLQTLTKAHHLTHRHLADVAGYSSHSYVGRLLRGQVTSVDPTPAALIARYFDVDLDALFAPRPSSQTGRSTPNNRKSAA